MASDAPKRVITLEEIEAEAARRKFSDDPEVEALRGLTLKQLTDIAENDEDPRQDAANKAISIAMKPITSMTNQWVSSMWSSTDVAKSVRNSIIHSGILPKIKFDIPNFQFPHPLGTSSSERAEDEELVEEDSHDDGADLTAAELAVTPVAEILHGIRDETERTNQWLLRVIDELAGMTATSQEAAATARQDAADAREDARKSRKSAWAGVVVAIVVGIFSVGATLASAILTSSS